jgi:NAD(P)-dependent dehydrogenase (short-subunit alcohol dehydrogenase family)
VNNTQIIFGGANGIGAHLAQLLVRNTTDRIIVVDREQLPRSNQLSDTGRFDFVRCPVEEFLPIASSLSLGSISSIHFIVPACRPREHTTSKLGYTKNFVSNISSLNFAFLQIIEALMDSFSEQSSIVFVSSVLAEKVGVGDATLDYHAAKSVLTSLVRYLAAVLAPNTTVNAVAPGLITRDGSNVLSKGGSFVEAVSRAIPLGRPCSQDEVARVMFALSQGQMSYVSGQTIVMDGAASVLEAFSAVRRRPSSAHLGNVES